MARRPWWPSALGDQVSLLNNFAAKIGTYEGVFGWEPEQTEEAEALTATFIAAIEYAEESKATMQAVTQWRDLVISGDPVGSSAIPIPTFQAPAALAFTRGNLQQFTKLRDQILANNNYTSAIGEDLGIVGAEITPPPPSAVQPDLKVRATGDTLSITGSMQGQTGLKIIYTPKGGLPREVAMLQTTPASIVITKSDPNEPENGTVQALFYKKNLPYGNESSLYPVTLS